MSKIIRNLPWIGFLPILPLIGSVIWGEVLQTNFHSLWIWTYLFLALLASLGFGLYASNTWNPTKLEGSSWSGLVFFGILLVLLLPTIFSPLFSGHWLTKPIAPDKSFGLNQLVLMVFFAADLYFVSVFDFKLVRSDFKKQSSFTGFLRCSIAYLAIVVAAIVSVYLIQWIHQVAEIDFDLAQLYRIEAASISFLVLFLLIFTLLFSFSSRIYQYIHFSKPGIRQKITGIIFSLAVLLLIFHLGPVKLELLPLGLTYLIFIISLDLYQDRNKLNSTWAISWMILITAFLSLLLFNLDFQHDIHLRKEQAKSIFTNRNLSFEKQIQGATIQSSFKEYASVVLSSEDEWLADYLKASMPVGQDVWFHPLTGSYQKRNVYNSDSSEVKTLLFLPNKSTLNPARKSFMYQHPFGVFYIHQLLFSNQLDLERFTLPNQFKNNPALFYQNGYSFIYYANNEQLSLIQGQKTPGLLRPISLFSLLFFLLSFSLFMVSLINRYIRFLPESMAIGFFEKKSLRNRIQLSIISLIICSFLVIGAVSHYYLRSLARESNQFAQLDHADLVLNRMQHVLSKNKDRSLEEQLWLFSMNESQLGRDDIFFYNSNGQRVAYNPREQRPEKKQMDQLPEEIINFLNAESTEKAYFAGDGTNPEGVFVTLNHSGESLYAFVHGKPHLTGGKRISDILATFLSIYTLLFILSGVIAIALSNSITRPIEILGKKLKSLKLSKQNEPVQWKNEDEIGALITIYNEMIQKLSDNARVMAKVERDSAWKEMAKQVAHEIKNPLTPLKLNIQYLESKIRMNPDEAREIVEQITPGLIEQIDNLSQIASEFSNFAQLPSARNEKIRLNEIVKTVHDFFRKREDLEFKLFVPINDILVFADRNHLVRIMNNVVKNAIQAIPADREGEIIIKLYTRGDDAVIMIRDNGSGIPGDMQDKVFSPNFTTKSSGTGLGLAISLNMLESFNGRIHFETEEGLGTDFFIEIPLMRLEDNYPETQTVLLDD